MNFEKEIIRYGRVVGSAADDGKGSPVWPTLELLTGGYYFTWRHDDGRFMGKISEFIFEDFVEWMKAQSLKDELWDFMEDTVGRKSTGEMFRFLANGCAEAKNACDVLINRFYDDNT